MTGLLLVLAARGYGAEPAASCDLELNAPADALSVAWVSPLRERAGRNEWIPVVATPTLRGWVRQGSGGNLARLLQHLGLRRRSSAPGRRYKVTIFDVRAQDLCRPLVGFEDPAAIEGAVTCAKGRSKPGKRSDGCGWTTDHATAGPGEELFLVRWDDAARNGFCVLPAERFLALPTP